MESRRDEHSEEMGPEIRKREPVLELRVTEQYDGDLKINGYSVVLQ